MSTHYKAYRFRMEPTKAQEAMLVKFAGARRFVWNWALARWKEHYEQTGKSIPYNQLSDELTQLRKKPETSWMMECSRTSLVQSLRDLVSAFGRFFKRLSRYPKFKSRKSDQPRFRTLESLRIESESIFISKIGLVKIRQSCPVPEKIKSATYRRRPDGNWYVSLLVEFELPDVQPIGPTPESTVGIDLGLKDFAVLSDGQRTPPPKFYRSSERKLRRAQRILSRRKPGSNRRQKAKLTVAKIHQKIQDKRADFLHKLTTQLIRDHGAVCIEDLNVKGLARTKLAKSFTDASMGEFRRQLEYKAAWNRKHVVVIDRFFPSSKMCGKCQAINQGLTLSDRHWKCDCGVTHDRDLNAAINIRDEGIRMLAARHAESLNAHGVHVSPAKVG